MHFRARGYISQIACGFLLTALCGQAYGGAWTQETGHGQMIVSGSYYSAGHFYDNSGERHAQPDYNLYGLNPYLEYGLAEGLTIGSNLQLERAHNDAGGQTNWNIGDSEFFVRKRLWQGNGFSFAAEPVLKLPSPESSYAEPKLGSSHPDLGLGLSGGYGFKAFGLDHFANLDTQYRHRLGPQRDQVKLSATLGASLAPKWLLMPQIFTTTRTSHPATASFTQSSADDYNQVRLQLSTVYKASDSVSLQLGGFKDVDGKNTSSGSGVLFAVWKRL